MKKLLLLLMVAALVACEKPFVVEGDDEEEVVPGDGDQRGEVLWTENDTARFYLQGIEISGVVLTDCPTPSLLIADPHYRLPTRLEAAQVLKFADMPKGYWQSGQRILCYDEPTGYYYTFMPHSTVTRAGVKTKYCILPIRSERTRGNAGLDITIHDDWE